MCTYFLSAEVSTIFGCLFVKKIQDKVSDRIYEIT
jgi:hypothetical protein